MADTTLPAPPQPPPSAKRRKGDPRCPGFVAQVMPCLSRDGPAPLTMAYADPPYPGVRRYETPEVNHEFLIRDLVEQFPDGWALSTSTTALKQLLAICPADVRIAAWVKPFASFKKGVNPAYAWEPVIFRGGRGRKDGKELTVRDWHACNITLERGFTGAKPEEFCFWIFDLLGLRECDTLIDLFHGSGAVTRAWEAYRRQGKLFGRASA